jgi:ABC-type transporter Mla subunit MlaD
MRALQGPGRHELQGAIGGFARTVDALAREQDSLGPLLRGTARTLHAVRVGADRPLDRTISALPAAFSAAASGGRSLEDIVARLEPLAAELRPGARELTPTLRALRPLLVRAREVLSPTPAFVRDLRDTLRSGAAATPATGRMLGLLDPTFEVLRDELLPFLRRDTKAGVPLYEQLSGVATSAGGSMAPVRTSAAAQAANAAPGHGWHYFARILGGATGTPACATVAEPIRAIMRNLGLCVG